MYLLLVCVLLLLDALITFPEEVSEKGVFCIFIENRQVGDCAKTTSISWIVFGADRG